MRALLIIAIVGLIASPALATPKGVGSHGAGPFYVQDTGGFVPSNPRGPGQGASTPRFQSRVITRGRRGFDDDHRRYRPRCRRGLFGRIVNADKCLRPANKRERKRRRY